MSFIVKGIDFPEKCGDCPCCVDYDNGVCIYSDNYNTGMFCSAQDSAPDVYDIHEKLNNCSLVEIPTPHGRLIDADRLLAVLKSMASTNESVPTTAVLELIDHQPVVLKAEVSELSQ